MQDKLSKKKAYPETFTKSTSTVQRQLQLNGTFHLYASWRDLFSGFFCRSQTLIPGQKRMTHPQMLEPHQLNLVNWFSLSNQTVTSVVSNLHCDNLPFLTTVLYQSIFPNHVLKPSSSNMCCLILCTHTSTAHKYGRWDQMIYEDFRCLNTAIFVGLAEYHGKILRANQGLGRIVQSL